MSHPRPPYRSGPSKRWAGALSLGLVTSGALLLGPTPAAHAVSGVFISEFHYDDSTANDAGGVGEFVEVTAPSGTDLTGWKVLLVNGNGNTVYRTDSLTGVVADQAGGWGTAVVSYPANTSGGVFQNGAPDGVALLDASGTVVEFVSYEGQMTASLGTPPQTVTSVDTGPAAVETNTTPGTHSLQRNTDGTWAAPAPHSKGVPNGGSEEAGPPSIVQPADRTGYLGEPLDSFSLTATGGTPPYAWAVTGLPAGVSSDADGHVSGTPTETGTFSVTATVTDSVGESDQATFEITVLSIDELPIAEIQGTGVSTPVADRRVSTRGVVTAEYATGGLNGFYIQTEGSGGPVDLAAHPASDGLFVFLSMSNANRAGVFASVEPGDLVRVTGTAGEYAGATQLTVGAPSAVEDLGTPASPVRPVVSAWPDTRAEKESLEGMLFAAGEHRFTISNTYNTNNFGEVGLAFGDRPLLQPTAVADAQDAAGIAAAVADNAARAITLDDGSSANFLASSDVPAVCGTRPTPCLTNGHLTPAYISNDEPIRVGATARFTAPVILTEGGSPSSPTYRFQPTEPVVGPENAASPAEFENTRTAAPDQARINAEGAADVTVASFNVLNYFTTLGDADDDNVGDGGCIPYTDRTGDGTNVDEGCDQRGAWDPQDFARQQEKIVAAINALDADVVGLMEIENSLAIGEQADEATQSLVTALNAAAGYEKWAANPSSSELPDPALMDVITSAIIYQPASVGRVGEARALGTQSAEGQAFDNAREPIAQAFERADGRGEPFLVVVNHFKSKGSGVNDGTGQGNANPDRIAQAEALAAWVPTVQSDLGIDATLLLGDFNSYAMEDPLQVLYGAGYTNLELHSGTEEHSYSFQGMSGSLDHVLVNDAALELYTGIDIWNINAGEALPLEYSRFDYHATNFHVADPYRSSDHDPVIVGLDLADDRAEASIEAFATPHRVWANKTRVKVHVAVSTGAERAAGTVVVTVEGQRVEAELRDGEAHLYLAPFATAGDKVVTVTYSGDDATAPALDTLTIHVERK